MKQRYIFLVAVSMTLIAADQGTKWWAATTLAERRMERARPACDEEGPIARRARYRPVRQIHVIEGLFSFRYVENCAGAFGILSEQDESIRRPFFLAVTVVAVIFIVLLFRRLTSDQRLLTWALPFVLGGALGNLVDRIHLRYVIDFIDMYHASIGRWPTYNVADMAIVIGVGLILLDMIPFKREAPSKAAKLGKVSQTSKSTDEASEQSDEEPEQSDEVSEQSDEEPEQTDEASEQSDDESEQSDDESEQSDDETEKKTKGDE